jgi:hypothetical protein
MIRRQPTYRPRHAKPEPPFRRALRSALALFVRSSLIGTLSWAAGLIPGIPGLFAQIALQLLDSLIDQMQLEDDREAPRG